MLNGIHNISSQVSSEGNEEDDDDDDDDDDDVFHTESKSAPWIPATRYTVETIQGIWPTVHCPTDSPEEEATEPSILAKVHRLADASGGKDVGLADLVSFGFYLRTSKQTWGACDVENKAIEEGDWDQHIPGKGSLQTYFRMMAFSDACKWVVSDGELIAPQSIDRWRCAEWVEYWRMDSDYGNSISKVEYKAWRGSHNLYRENPEGKKIKRDKWFKESEDKLLLKEYFPEKGKPEPVEDKESYLPLYRYLALRDFQRGVSLTMVTKDEKSADKLEILDEDDQAEPTPKTHFTRAELRAGKPVDQTIRFRLFLYSRCSFACLFRFSACASIWTADDSKNRTRATRAQAFLQTLFGVKC